MATIEERAEEFAIEKAGIPNGLGAKYFEDLYVQIAKEQREIDIKAAAIQVYAPKRKLHIQLLRYPQRQ